MSGWLVAALMTALNVAVAIYSGRQRRRADRALARTLDAIGDFGRLQHAVDRAWDAAHEFGDEPHLALEVVCAHLEHHVTSLTPEQEAGIAESLERWLQERADGQD